MSHLKTTLLMFALVCGLFLTVFGSTIGSSANASGRIETIAMADADVCTDMGEDPYQRDTVTIYRKNGEVWQDADVCLSDGRLQEQRCTESEDYPGAKNFGATYRECKNGCKDGACLQSCDSLKENQQNFFSLCREDGYETICFSNEGKYMGCGYRARNDCTSNNNSAATNILCDATLTDSKVNCCTRPSKNAQCERLAIEDCRNANGKVVNSCQECFEEPKIEKKYSSLLTMQNNDDHVFYGNLSNASVALIEYADLECPFCKSHHETMKRVQAELGTNAAWVFRHFPLSMHKNAFDAALVSECIAAKGGNDAFWAFIDGVFSKGTTEEIMKDVASTLGIRVETVKNCFDRTGKEEKYHRNVKEDIANGKELGITGTPTTFVVNINTKKAVKVERLDGAVPYEEVFRAVKNVWDGTRPGIRPQDGEDEIGFRNATWACYDGVQSEEGGPTSCKSSETWQKYAAESCDRHCYNDGSKCGVNSFNVYDECRLSGADDWGSDFIMPPRRLPPNPVQPPTIAPTIVPMPVLPKKNMQPAAGYEDEVRVNYVVEENPFPDTDIASLDGIAAAELYRRAVIGGFPDGTFRGKQPVNRAEAAKFLLLARYGDVAEASNNGRFPDVLDGEWYTKYIVTAADLGIIAGHPGGLFKPADQVLRSEFAKMLSLTFDLPIGGKFRYTDVVYDAWYAPYAGIAERFDLFPGRHDLLLPGQPLTRGEVAVAIYQYLKNR